MTGCPQIMGDPARLPTHAVFFIALTAGGRVRHGRGQRRRTPTRPW